MKITGIIPARYASSRFPGKPLAIINGKPMIQRVYEQAGKCGLLTEVIVATDDERILNAVAGFGGKAVMTAETHTSGTERCHEVLKGLSDRPDVVINIQGDEPYIEPAQIEQVAELFKKDNVNIATLKKKIRTTSELFNPNVVKVLTARGGKALYFSRNPLPYVRGTEEGKWMDDHDFFKHIGIYGYRSATLEEIVALPASPPEKAESLEQLRWLWHGFEVQVGETEYESVAVDTPEDLSKLTNKAEKEGH